MRRGLPPVGERTSVAAYEPVLAPPGQPMIWGGR
jgi:hypothetical protein